MNPPRLSSRLLNWYRRNGRILPWRDHPDPYAVWISEIMLQQTRVETVIPYFDKWMKMFPTVHALANATEQNVLNAWEGLGYYSRARNLYKAAQIVVSQHKGELPRDLGALRKLPGIGRYTVGAIASLVFGMDEPALDGNLKRVYARLFDVTEPADSTKGEKILWDLAAQNLPRGRAGDFNQALMDLGAMICLPKNPRCLLCPLMEMCKACENGTQGNRPVLGPKKVVPHHIHAAGVIIRRGRVLLAKRSSKGLLAGMWEFPNGRVSGNDPARGLAKALETGYRLRLRAEPGRSLRKKETLGIFQHAYTHFRVTVHAFRCDLVSISRNESIKWVALNDLEDYPMGKIDRLIARRLLHG